MPRARVNKGWRIFFEVFLGPVLCFVLVLFFGSFLVRLLVVLGCHVGAFLDAKSGQHASFFGFFF